VRGETPVMTKTAIARACSRRGNQEVKYKTIPGKWQASRVQKLLKDSMFAAYSRPQHVLNELSAIRKLGRWSIDDKSP
jgi:hypothetical protein